METVDLKSKFLGGMAGSVLGDAIGVDEVLVEIKAKAALEDVDFV